MGDKHHDGVDTKLVHLVGLILIPFHSLSPEFLAWIRNIVGEICHPSSTVSSDITVFLQLLFYYLVVWHLDSSKAVVSDNGTNFHDLSIQNLQKSSIFIWNFWHFANDAIFSFRDCILEITHVSLPQHFFYSCIFTFIMYLKMMFCYAPIFCLINSYLVTWNCIWFFIYCGSDNTPSKYSPIRIWSIFLTWNYFQWLEGFYTICTKSTLMLSFSPRKLVIFSKYCQCFSLASVAISLLSTGIDFQWLEGFYTICTKFIFSYILHKGRTYIQKCKNSI